MIVPAMNNIWSESDANERLRALRGVSISHDPTVSSRGPLQAKFHVAVTKARWARRAIRPTSVDIPEGTAPSAVSL